MPSKLDERLSTGQTFMPDYFASIVVFTFLLMMFLSTWSAVLDSQSSFDGAEAMRFRARHTTSFLVSMPGYPEKWEKPGVDVRIPGFASTDHVLQESKLEAFRDLSYREQSEILLAREFYMSVRNSTGVMRLNGKPLEFGKNYSGGRTVVPITRSVMVNLSGNMRTAKLRYVVWR
ncbi:MAG: hypothetical protein ABEJ07_00895 [Candidatus Nanohaloarchaea archaeon]